MATSAESKGRLDSFAKAEADGIILKKEWIATKDNRTRDWHAELDGQLADRDKPFINSIGEIMYPGDPHADPANTYNCRCTLGSKILGFNKSFYEAKFDREKGENVAQWRAKKDYEKYRAEIGSNVPKTLEEFMKIRYNKDEYRMFKSYAESLQSGELSFLADFDLYKSTATEINKKIIGKYTSDGILIEKALSHFIARSIGSIEQRRNGVSIDDALKALTFPSETREYSQSKKYIFDKVCEVTLNSKTGTLIQTNPIHRKKGKKE